MTRPRRLGPSEPEERPITPREGDTSAEGGRWKRFSENKVGKSIIAFVLTAPYMVAYFAAMPILLQGIIGGGITLPWCRVIAACLFMMVTGVIHYTWGEHWPLGKKIRGFTLLAIIVGIVTLIQIIYNKPPPPPGSPSASASSQGQQFPSSTWKKLDIAGKKATILEVDKVHAGQEYYYLGADQIFHSQVDNGSTSCWREITPADYRKRFTADWDGVLKFKFTEDTNVQFVTKTKL